MRYTLTGDWWDKSRRPDGSIDLAKALDTYLEDSVYSVDDYDLAYTSIAQIESLQTIVSRQVAATILGFILVQHNCDIDENRKSSV